MLDKKFSLIYKGKKGIPCRNCGKKLFLFYKSMLKADKEYIKHCDYCQFHWGIKVKIEKTKRNTIRVLATYKNLDTQEMEVVPSEVPLDDYIILEYNLNT
jgi:uncharacterized Zn finger protein